MENPEPDRFSKPPLAIFLSYYKPHWKLFAGDMLCALLVAAVDIIFPVLSRYTLDSIIAQGLSRALLLMALAMAALFVARAAAYWFVDYWGHAFGTRVEADMRRDIFAHIERQGFAFFDKQRTGHIMSRVTTDLFEVTELAHHGPEDVFISLLTILGAFGILLAIRFEIALAILFYVPAVSVFAMLNRKKLSAASRKVKEKTAEINAVLESSISGARVTQAFANEAFEGRRFERGNSEFKDAKKQFYKAMAFFHAKYEFPMNMLNVLVLALGGWFIMQGKMTLSDLVAANLLVSAMMGPIRRLSSFVEQYTSGMAGFKRFVEIMRTHCEVPQKEGAAEISFARGNIRYEHVDFSYTPDFPVLRDVNLDIKAGQTVAFVGTSGAGKTTLCQLLPRFYELTGGRILLDGLDIKDLTLESLRRQIGLVQQDVFLFAGTIKENIAYGRIGAGFDEIVLAAKRAEIHDDILKMPDGYDTLVGERGIRLSGGQKQRVSIARAFLKNPPIIILDEATSALDTATELRIQRSFDELSKGRTSLVIAHRLSTIRNADCIAVIDGSRIAELGTHDELMRRNALYAALYSAQALPSG